MQGRWINRDPIGEDGGVNLFQYCHNSPLIWRDPKGTQEATAMGMALGGLPGGLIGLGLDIAGAIGIGYGGAVLMNQHTAECQKEWEEAYDECLKLITNPPPMSCKGITGGYKNLRDCARGLVSVLCGGNRLGE